MPQNQNTTKVRGFAGLVNTLLPEDLSGADRTRFPLLEAQNVYLTNARRLKSRPGFALAAAGNFHSLWSTGDVAYTMKRNANQLVALDSDLNETSLRSGMTPNSPISFAAAADRVYYMNDVGERGMIDGTTHLPWGLPVPAAPSLAAGAGALPAGTYQVAVTQRLASGEESGCWDFVQIALSSTGGIVVTLPTADADAAEFSVYCSRTNGGEMYEVARVAVGTSTTTIVNQTAHGQLLKTLDVFPPPSGDHIAYHKGRIYVAKGNYVYYSDALAHGWFRENQFWAFNDTVRLIAPVDNGVFICADKVYFFSGTDPRQANPDEVLDAQAVKGTLEYLYPGDFPEISRPHAAWITDRGFVLGAPGGTAQLLTENEFTFAVSPKGSLNLIKRDGVPTLVGLMQTPSDDTNDFGLADRISAEVVRNTVV